MERVLPCQITDNPEDWTHRTGNRPVRYVAKISHTDENVFMDDINDVHNLTKDPEDNIQNLATKLETDAESGPSENSDDLNPDNHEDHFDDEKQDDVFNDKLSQNIPVPVIQKNEKKIRIGEI